MSDIPVEKAPAAEEPVQYWLCLNRDQLLSTDNADVYTETESLFYLSPTKPSRDADLADSEPFLLRPSWAAPYVEHWNRADSRLEAAQSALEIAQAVFSEAIRTARKELRAVQAEYAPTEQALLTMRNEAEAVALTS